MEDLTIKELPNPIYRLLWNKTKTKNNSGTDTVPG